jgi:RimJ/RimL family protein N-acetyltransferase
MIVLETNRLLLKHFTLDDAAFILRLLNEPSFIQNVGDKGVRTLEQASGYLIEGPIKSYQIHGHGLYLVALKESLQPIGMCGLLKRDQFDDVDLGYAFLPEFWSKGFAHESASAVLKFGLNVLRRTKILAIVSPGNAASIKVLKKLGFAFSKYVQISPEDSEVALYEWQQHKVEAFR